MHVYAAELICSTGVSGFQTSKLVFCIYNKLRLHAEILSEWENDTTFSYIPTLWGPIGQFGTWVMVDRPMKFKTQLTVNNLWIKIKAQNFASQVLSKQTFKIWSKKKKVIFFFITGALQTFQ